MKTLIRLIPTILILTGIIGFSSCEKKNTENSDKGKLEISLSLPDKTNQSKSGTSSDSSGIVTHHLMISIEDMEGNDVMSDSLIPLYTFGTDFISEKVELMIGQYKLTKFMVIDPSGDVVYAAPAAGSPLAYLVNRSLPLTFNIFSNQVTRIVPEVLAVGDASFRQKCLQRIDLLIKNGTSIIFVSHNMPMIQAVCESALYILEGKIAYQGRTKDVINIYQRDVHEGKARRYDRQESERAKQSTKLQITPARTASLESYSLQVPATTS